MAQTGVCESIARELCERPSRRGGVEKEKLHEGGKKKPSGSRTNFLQQSNEDNKVQNHVAVKLYKEVIENMHDSRFHSKSALFEELLYLFISWKRTGLKLDQDATKMSWYIEYDKDVHLVPMSRIPLTDTSTNLKVVGSSATAAATKVNTLNVENLTDVITAHPEMILVVSHEVIIHDGTDGTNGSEIKSEEGTAPGTIMEAKDEVTEEESEWETVDDSGENSTRGDTTGDATKTDSTCPKKTLTRTLNLIDISARFLSC